MPYLLIVRDSLIRRTTRTSRGNWLLLVIGQTLVAAPALAQTQQTEAVSNVAVQSPGNVPAAASSSSIATGSVPTVALTTNPALSAPAVPSRERAPLANDPDSGSAFAKQFPKSGPEIDRGAADTSSKSSRTHSRSLAAVLDAGLPDGVVAGLAYRPAFWTRLQAGAGYNSISPGVRLGAVLIPFSEGPSLTIEGGYYSEGDANSIISSFAGPAYAKTRTLQKVGYQFVNFHAGLDFGSTFATFFIHGGMTYLRTTLHDANDVFGGKTVSPQGDVTTFTFHQDMNLNLWFPSCKLGLLVYIV